MSTPHVGSAIGDALSGPLSDASSVLLVASDDSPVKTEGCEQLLSAGVGADAEHVVGVAYRPDDAFYERLTEAGVADARRTVVAVSGSAGGHESVETIRVSDATSVPSRVRERLDEFDGESGVLCFDALGPLVRDIGLTRTFRFVNGLTADLRDTDTVAHFHLDPEMREEQGVDALTTVFDAMVQTVDDEHWAVAWTRNGD